MKNAADTSSTALHPLTVRAVDVENAKLDRALAFIAKNAASGAYTADQIAATREQAISRHEARIAYLTGKGA